MKIERYENKYLISPLVFRKLLCDLKKYMVLDAYLNGNDYYYVNSMYFDSFCLANYYDKIEGQLRRKKVRIRTYKKDYHDSDYYFGEVKKKTNLYFVKDRIKISKKEAYDISSFHRCDISGNSLEQSEFYKQIFLHTNHPTCFVRYKRIPLLAMDNKNFRVSFDFDLQGAFVSKLPFFKKLLKENDIIFEIKFHKSFPKWMNELIKKYDLFARSISKYCLAIESLNILKGEFV